MDPLVGPSTPAAALLPLQEHKDARSVHGNLVVGEECGKDQRFQLVAGWFSTFNYFFVLGLFFSTELFFCWEYIFILRSSPLLCQSGVV